VSFTETVFWRRSLFHWAPLRWPQR
jgi:hypothetical protein